MVFNSQHYHIGKSVPQEGQSMNLNPKTEHSKKSVVSFRVIFMQNFRYTLFELYRREWTG